MGFIDLLNCVLIFINLIEGVLNIYYYFLKIEELLKCNEKKEYNIKIDNIINKNSNIYITIRK